MDLAAKPVTGRQLKQIPSKDREIMAVLTRKNTNRKTPLSIAGGIHEPKWEDGEDKTRWKRRGQVERKQGEREEKQKKREKEKKLIAPVSPDASKSWWWRSWGGKGMDGWRWEVWRKDAPFFCWEGAEFSRQAVAIKQAVYPRVLYRVPLLDNIGIDYYETGSGVREQKLVMGKSRSRGPG
jgi:hypothetical protein